jgi:alpha-2-macroglobulin
MRNSLSAVCWALIATLVVLCVPGFAIAANPGGLTVYAYRANDLEGKKENQWDWAVRLSFNHPVFLENLNSTISVKVDGEDDDFEILDAKLRKMNEEQSKSFIIVPTKRYEKPVSVNIDLDKGLGDFTGKKTLLKDFAYRFVTVETVSVKEVSTFFKSRQNKGLKIRLSHNVPPGEFSKAIKITPEVAGLQVSGQGRTCVVQGDFQHGQSYTLNVNPTPAEKGYFFSKYDYTFKGPGLDREASIKTNRSVIELIGRQLAPVTLSNMPAVRCSVTRVPPAMLPKENDPEKILAKAPDLKTMADSMPAESNFFAAPTREAEVFFAPESKDKIISYSIPLSFRKNPDKGGAWLVSLTDPDGKWKGSVNKLVQITDLALSYKISEKSLLVWVTSFHTGKPVADASIMLETDGGKLCFVGKTNKDGVLLIHKDQSFPAVVPGGEGKPQNEVVPFDHIRWIVAATKDDSGGIKINSDELKPSSVKQTKGLKDKPDFMTGYIFTERGVYKPGETVFFKFLARAYKEGIVSPKGESVDIEITNPREDVVYQESKALNEFGSCNDRLETEKFFPTGTYTIKASMRLADSRAETFTDTFMVQEFKKIRHFATMSMKTAQKRDSEYIGIKVSEELLNVEVSGQYYTGGPVKNGQVRWKATLVPVTTTVAGYDGYTFGSEDTDERFLESGDSVLDANGKLKFTIPLDPKLMTGPFGIKVSATVLDVDGEPATDVQTYGPKPKYAIGIGNHPTQVEYGYTSPLSVMVLDANGKPVQSGNLQAVFMQKQSFYVTKRDEAGNPKETWEEGWTTSFSAQQPVSAGKAVVPISFNTGGDYLVEFAVVEDGNRYASRARFEVGWSTRWRRAERDEESINKAEVFISLNKKEYRTGETAQAQFTIPKPAKKCLVTLEKSAILEYKLVDLQNGSGSFKFQVKDEYRPNLYISVLAPVGRDGYPVYSNQADVDIPMTYYGYIDVSVRNEDLKLKLEIDPETHELRGRPAEEKKLSFKVSDSKGKGVVAEMAVCVVDEAILALTRFRTPELSSLTKFDLPLAVFQGDLRLQLISQDLFRMVATRPLTGGGVGLGEVNPSLRKDFRPVAYFNPSVITDESGKATVEFKLPDTTTAYRVYAVVCDKEAGFVSGQRNMVVTKEFFLEPSTPRFMIQGDNAKFPIVLHNKTKEKGTALVEGKGGEGLKVQIPEAGVTLEPLSSALIKGDASLTGRPQKAVFTFNGKFTEDKGSFTDAVEYSIPVHSKYLPVTRVNLGDFTDKSELMAALPEYLATMDPQALNPMDFKALLSFSRTSWSKLAPGLKYLLNYPYGCIEQTSSGVIPLAGIKGLVKAGLFQGVTEAEVDKYLQGGVDRILAMQTQNGGFGYWPGDQEPSWWGSLYATFALLNTKQAGLEIPEDRLHKALSYIREGVFDKHSSSDHWTDELGLFALAAGGKLSPQELDRHFEGFDALNNQSKAYLLMAAHKVGYADKKKLLGMAQKLDPKFHPDRINYYDSTYREMAVCLMAGIELGLPHEKTDVWAGSLMRGLKPEGRWGSTADTGWCLLALSDYYKGKAPGKQKSSKVTVTYGDKSEEFTLAEVVKDLELDARTLLKNPVITMRSDSKDMIHATLTLVYPEEQKEEKEPKGPLHLTKIIENLNGGDEIRVGDVVRVTLTVNLSGDQYDKTYEYLALEDPVPAGLVAINSELKTEGMESRPRTEEDDENQYGRYYYSGSEFTPSFQEIRDDGVRAFKNRIWAGSYKYTYLARAVIEGEFWMRGSRLSQMYQPEISASVPGKKVIVLPSGK